jgi:hypothetical protein
MAELAPPLQLEMPAADSHPLDAAADIGPPVPAAERDAPGSSASTIGDRKAQMRKGRTGEASSGENCDRSSDTRHALHDG